MKLTERQLYRANRFHAFLKNQPNEYYKENEITPCPTCGRTGLTCYELHDQNGKVTRSAWDTQSYCDDCNGIGYQGRANGVKIDDQNFVCRKCDGIGCKTCDHTGIVDWVTNLMGG